MKHSLVIVTMNRPFELKRLLLSVLQQTRLPDEIVIVDAGQGSEAAEAVPELDDRLRVIPGTIGISAQRNRGLDEARGDIITYVDDDAQLSAEYCEISLGYFEREADIVALSGINTAAVFPGRLQRWLRRLFAVQTGCASYLIRRSGIPDVGAHPDSRLNAEVLPAGALSLRRAACHGLRFEEYWLSGIPLGFETGRCFGEDVFFTYQLSRRGTMIVIPEAEFSHIDSMHNRESVFVTQALYVFALRWISDAITFGPRRLLRLWALAGQCAINVAQTLRYRDSAYLRGYIRAMCAKMK